MHLKKMRVRNFRSLEDIAIDFKQFSILTGNNDVGKSNFLRALNLFFNGHTDSGIEFEFINDFSKTWRAESKKAKEISITLTISPPATYEGGGAKDIVWEKKWRATGLHSVEIKYEDGSNVSGRSKIPAWLERIQFHYVPAIKGNEYFKILLKDIYRVLDATSGMQGASTTFVDYIKKITSVIGTHTQAHLGFSSHLELPTDLSDIFSRMELFAQFNDDEEDGKISMSQRGDGVKVSHIPILLQFIADQRNVNAGRGTIKSISIWGYEEPENNLELNRCYELADRLFNISSSIQVICSTHSPAFYSQGQKADAVCYFVKKIAQKTQLETHSKNVLDNEMGLMPLVAEHIVAARAALKESQEKIEQLKRQPDLPTIYVEGGLEFSYLWRVFDYMLEGRAKTKLNIINCQGANMLANYVRAHMLIRSQIPAWYLLDNDKAGADANTKITDAKQPKSDCKIYGGILCTKPYPANETIIKINKKMHPHKPDYEFEHMFGESFFCSLPEDMLAVKPFRFTQDISPEISVKDYLIQEKGLEESEWRFVAYKVKNEHKKAFLNKVLQEEYFDEWVYSLAEKIAKDLGLL